VRAFTAAERRDLYDRASEIEAWPEYQHHGDVLNRYWRRLHDERADFQFALVDEESGDVVAQGHSIPVVWDGTAEGLPAGVDGQIAAGFEPTEAPTALGALAIEIDPGQRGRGLSRTMIEAMAEIGRRHGLADLIAPVRPSWKERYPVTPIERYAAWTREDGLPFDPWMRVHARLGAEILKPEPESLRITGTVAEWEAWTEMPFPESGEYVFPHGLAPLTVDRDADLGAYWEPNVWMRHRIAS
jgi:GNAT superfamily N-acetyltransferase